MAFPTLKFVFNRKKTATATKPASIEVAVNYSRRHKYFFTGVKVLPSQWDASRGVVNCDNAFLLNQEIEKKMQEVKEAINTIFVRGEAFSLSAVVLDKEQRNPQGNFIKYIEDKNAARNDIRESTRRTQRKLAAVLADFGRIKTFADVTLPNIRRFDHWLHEKYDKQTTVHSYHKFLKIYIRLAILDGYLSKDPYTGIRIERGASSERRFLKDEEITAIENIETDDKSVMKARDMFLFQCYTGLAYCDMAMLVPEDINVINGKHILHKQRNKTSVVYHIVLLKPALDILKKYNFRLPIISNQKYNMLLKVVAVKANINFNLSSHCGRHSFATWCLNRGVPIETLKEMMGHSDIKTTAIYGKLLSQTVENEFEKLNKCFDI